MKVFCPVAIETSRGLLVVSVRATGRPMYAINPLAVSRYRERHTVARAKSDHADAVVLANILRTDADVHRLLPSDSELVQSIAVLARGGQDAVWNRADRQPVQIPSERILSSGNRSLQRLEIRTCLYRGAHHPGRRTHPGIGRQTHQSAIAPTAHRRWPPAQHR